MFNQADLEAIHRFSTNHRGLLAQSSRAGCFHCRAIFQSNDIVDWIDVPQTDSGNATNGVTALCPQCGIDAVLPSAAPIPLSEALLSAMKRHWFDK